MTSSLRQWGLGDDASTVGDPTAQEILPDVVQENCNQLHPEVDHDEVCGGAGVEVDDDNLPAPENIPTPNEEVQSAGDWGI